MSETGKAAPKKPKAQADLDAALAKIEALKKENADLAEKASASEDVITKKGFAVAYREPSHPVHQAHWLKCDIIPCVKIEGEGDEKNVFVFKAEHRKRKFKKKFTMNQGKKGFDKFFKFIPTKKKAEEFVTKLQDAV